MSKAVYISVTLFVGEDTDQEQINDMIAEVDYSFKHPMICDTRINGEIDSDNAF